MKNITIVGAGLVGSLLSIYLARAGFNVRVYERGPDLREVNRHSGKSVNIALCERGFRALDAVGIGDVIRKLCIPLTGRMIHDINGQATYHPYGNNQEALYAIQRNDLSYTLFNSANSYPNINFYFNQKCTDIDLPTATVEFHNTQTGEISQVEAEQVFAADGAYSAVRQVMQKQKCFNYSQQYIEHAYKEIVIPKLHEESISLDRNSLHVWPRGSFTLLGFPNPDRSFALSLHLPYEGKISHESITDVEKLKQLFAEYFPDLLSLVEPYWGDYFTKPAGAMVTIKCWPWAYQNKVVLIGDACHAIIPYYGQGANAGFEDCQVLMECFMKHPEDWHATFHEYQTLRKPNMDIIADLCFEHFIVLTKKVGDSKFQLQQKIEKKIQEIYPSYASLHQNICFTTMPYSESCIIDRKFQNVIDKIALSEAIEEKLENLEGELIIKKYLQEAKL